MNKKEEKKNARRQLAIQIAVRNLLTAIGEDPDRDGLKETPNRVAKSFLNELCAGYNIDPISLLKTFEPVGYDGIILVKNIALSSLCVVGSTFVETPRGRIPISWLKDKDWIYTVDPATREVGLVRCENPRITKRGADLVRVYTDNDTVICTPDHRFLATSGEWVEASNTRAGMKLVSFYRSASENNTGQIYPRVLANPAFKKSKNKTVKNLSLLGKGSLPEHRLVALLLGNKLGGEQHMVAHHKDEVPWNNLPENLEIISTGEHNRRHARTQKLAHNENRKRAAAEASGRPEVREKRSESVKKHWENMTEEERFARTQAIKEGITLSKNHVVLGVESVSQKEDVWCLTVPGTHTYFTNGIASHNCEHHIIAFTGHCHVAYLPNDRVVGLSKIARVVDAFAKRLQVQERLTTQIADCLMEGLDAKGVLVTIAARHHCMEIRGVNKPGTLTVTSSIRGIFKTDENLESKVYQLLKEEGR